MLKIKIEDFLEVRSSHFTDRFKQHEEDNNAIQESEEEVNAYNTTGNNNPRNRISSHKNK